MATVNYLAVGHAFQPFLGIVDPSTRRYVRTSDAMNPGGTGTSVAFNPAGTRLAVGYTLSPRLRVYNTDTWALVSGTPSLGSTVNGVDFNPAGTRLAAAYGTSPQLIVIDTSDWSTVSGTPTLGATGTACRFSPDGTMLAVTYSSKVTVYLVSDWSVVHDRTLASTANGVAWHPSGTYLAVAHANGDYLTVLDTSDWSVVSGTPALPFTGWTCAFSPDGTTLAVGHSSSPYLTIINTSDWSASTGSLAIATIGRSVAYSADNRLAVAYESYPWLTVFDKVAENILWEPGYLAGNGRSVAWSFAAPAGTLSGNVQDDEENPVQRAVIAIRDDTDDVAAVGVSDSGTGNFSLTVPHAGGHTVLMRESTGRVRVLGGGIEPL